MDYSFLKASNGAGDAALMHITADRLVGSTTIDVDTVVNVPDKFIATYGTLGSDGFITAASKRDLVGHLSGSGIIIDEFLPGSTDAGNTEGQVVVIRPNTPWANKIIELAQVGHKDDGTHKNALPLTSPILTTPEVVTAFMDTNGNELFRVLPANVAVNDLTIANANAGLAPSIAASGDEADVSWVAKGKGAGRFLPQVPVFSGGVSGGVIGTTETIVASIVVPAQPVATNFLFAARAFLNWPTSPPSWVGQFRLRDTNVAGAELFFDSDTKSAATGINNTGHVTLVGNLPIAANTAKTLVLTFKTDSNFASSVVGSFWAIQVAQ